MADKKIGRPRKAEDDKLVSLSLRVRPSEYDRWYDRARVERRPIAEVVRDVLERTPSR